MSKINTTLAQYYREAGISVHGFRCPHKVACESDAGRPLTHGAEAHVGSKYGERLRVAVVSLDTGGGSDDLDERRRVVESLESPMMTLNPHMKGTLRCLQALFGVDGSDRSVVQYFAMINAAKCAATGGKRDMVPSALYGRCRPYAKEELALLEPDVIVAQGTKARDVLQHRTHVSTEHLRAAASRAGTDATVTLWLIALGREYLRQVTLKDGTFALGLLTPHPSARQGQWQRFDRTCLDPVAWLARGMLDAAAGVGT